jgi:hypothetical protein
MPPAARQAENKASTTTEEETDFKNRPAAAVNAAASDTSAGKRIRPEAVATNQNEEVDAVDHSSAAAPPVTGHPQDSSPAAPQQTEEGMSIFIIGGRTDNVFFGDFPRKVKYCLY